MEQKKKRSKAFANITRIKNAKNRRDEYWVRVQRNGEQIASRHFYDEVCGGALAARERAKAYRDEILENHPKASRQEFAQRPMGNNTSGIIGVQKIKRPGSQEIAAYRVRWIPKKGGKRVSATFTVEEYGADAERYAVEARVNAIYEMEN